MESRKSAHPLKASPRFLADWQKRHKGFFPSMFPGGQTTPKLAYLIGEYPKISHSFIRREILALERLGWSILRLSINGWDAELVDPEHLCLAQSYRTMLESSQECSPCGHSLRQTRRNIPRLHASRRRASLATALCQRDLALLWQINKALRI